MNYPIDPRFIPPARVATPADFEWARQQHVKFREQQDQQHRAEMRKVIGAMEAQGPIKGAVKNAVWIGVGAGVLGFLLGPGKNGEPRALRWATKGAIFGAGSSLLAYYFVEGFKPKYMGPKA